jgi:predicted lipoprotein with Yx(FWY)xxD motif
MKSFVLVNRLGFMAALLVATMLGCKKDDNAVTTPASDVAVASTSLGNVLTGADGKTLYFFAPDVTGTSSCTGNCIATWPVFYKETPSLGTGLKASDFATITRSDGSKQSTFKGWPLYYYANDAKAGDVNGENVGNVWMVAKSNYTVMFASRQLVGNDGKNYTFDTKEGTGNSIFLTDSVGRTLYAFAPDKKNTNTYTKADLSNNPVWPIFETSATIGEIPSAFKKADFAIIKPYGKTQLTYKGWPLYYFGADNAQRGSTKGVSVPRPGVWPVVNSTSVDAPN